MALLAAGLAAAGYWSWPMLGYTLAPAGVWLVAVPALLWKRPRQALRLGHMLLAALVLMAGVSGLLELYQPGWGGVLGEEVIGPSLTVGGLRLFLIGLVSLVVASPVHAWRFTRSGALHGWPVVLSGARLAAVGLPMGARGAEWLALRSGRLAWALLKLGGRLLRRAARGYVRHPLHRPLLRAAWRGVTIPARAARRLRRRRPSPVLAARSAKPFALRPPREPAGDTPLAGSGFITRPFSAPPDPAAWETVPPPEEEPAPHPRPDGRDVPTGQGAGGEPQIMDWRAGTWQGHGRLGDGGDGWSVPPLDTLKAGERRWVSEAENRRTAQHIEEALREFGIEVEVSEVRPGPVVTQYGLAPGWVRRFRDVRERDAEGNLLRDDRGKPLTARVEEKTRVKVDRILAREKDLALALAAPSIRFEAPVPSESFVGLEVPNARPSIVSLRSLLESETFRGLQKKGRLPIALGQGSGGEAVVTDLAEMPHLLIAGATGSGKSVCMNTVICSLVMQLTPRDLQMYMVDPKRVEMTQYSGLPHLAAPVLVEVDQAVPTLRAVIAEMQSRYKRFEAAGVRDIQAFNRKEGDATGRIPYLALVIDELADLMMTAPTDVEQSLCRLAQLGRATGIHLVIATQRPSVDVLTGLIKANFPSRISFKVSSQVDSRTILDGAGAEKLLGRGDMLFMPSNSAKPKRLQGAFISDDEIHAIARHWKGQRGNRPPKAHTPKEPERRPLDSDLEEARELALKHNRISASLLQRRLGVGYAKASSLLDHLEEMGIVGSGDPGMSRRVVK